MGDPAERGRHLVTLAWPSNLAPPQWTAKNTPSLCSRLVARTWPTRATQPNRTRPDPFWEARAHSRESAPQSEPTRDKSPPLANTARPDPRWRTGGGGAGSGGRGPDSRYRCLQPTSGIWESQARRGSVRPFIERHRNTEQHDTYHKRSLRESLFFGEEDARVGDLR